MARKNSPGCGCCARTTCPTCTNASTPLSGFNVTFSGVVQGTRWQDGTFPIPAVCTGSVITTTTNMTDLNATFFVDCLPSGGFGTQIERCTFDFQCTQNIFTLTPGTGVVVTVYMNYFANNATKIVSYAYGIIIANPSFSFGNNPNCSAPMVNYGFSGSEAYGPGNNTCKQIITSRTFDIDAEPRNWIRRFSAPSTGCYHCNPFADGFADASVTIAPVWYE